MVAGDHVPLRSITFDREDPASHVIMDPVSALPYGTRSVSTHREPVTAAAWQGDAGLPHSRTWNVDVHEHVCFRAVLPGRHRPRFHIAPVSEHHADVPMGQRPQNFSTAVYSFHERENAILVLLATAGSMQGALLASLRTLVEAHSVSIPTPEHRCHGRVLRPPTLERFVNLRVVTLTGWAVTGAYPCPRCR